MSRENKPERGNILAAFKGHELIKFDTKLKNLGLLNDASAQMALESLGYNLENKARLKILTRLLKILDDMRIKPDNVKWLFVFDTQQQISVVEIWLSSGQVIRSVGRVVNSNS